MRCRHVSGLADDVVPPPRQEALCACFDAPQLHTHSRATLGCVYTCAGGRVLHKEPQIMWEGYVLTYTLEVVCVGGGMKQRCHVWVWV